MLTKLLIENGKNKYDSLALAPVSVLPEHQNKGIGSKLISESLKIAKEIGFKPARIWGIKSPFDVLDNAFMALELEVRGLDGVTGTVVYSKEFFE